MDTLLQDIRYAARRLAHSPGFTALAVVVLALGIGGTATAFGVVDAVLLRPLAYPDAGALVRVFSTRGGDSRWTASPPDFRDWQSRNRSFIHLAATNSGSFALTGEGAAEQLPGAQATGDLFTVLGVAPLLGRTLTPADDAFGGLDVAVLGFGLWRDRFGGDPKVLGRQIRLDGRSYTVIGVMPAGFDYPDGAELWLPLRFSAADLVTQRGAHYLDVVGRLRPGVAVAAADRDIGTVAGQLAQTYPHSNAAWGATATSLRDAMVGDVRTPLLIVLVAVGLVLLIACTNVAGLLIVRGLSREREVAIRTALGAHRGRLIRGLLTESAVLAVLGGVGGTLLALWGTATIAHVSGANIPLLDETRLGGGVFGFIGLVTGLTVLIFGILPAWQTAGAAGLGERLRAGSRGTTGARIRTRNILVMTQTALAVLLLVGAGLLVRSFARLRAVDPGFDPRHVLSFGVSLPDGAYPRPGQSALFYRQLAERLQGLPGVRSAGAVFGLPLTGFGYSISASAIDGRTLPDEEQEAKSVQIRVVTPGYFATLGVPVRRGRGIVPADRPGAPPVIVVNQAAARLLWPGQEPLGHHLTVGTRLGVSEDQAGGEVVGMIGDLKERGLGRAASPTIYLAHAQFPVGSMSVAVRTTEDPLALIPAARAALAATDPNVPWFRVRSMEQLVSASVAQPRLYALLLAVFALVAVALAGVGLYGVLAQTVVQRSRELGVRMALGATGGNVVGLVVGQAARLAAAGVVVGLLAGLAGARLLTSMLFGVQPRDPATFAAVGLGLFGVALVATFVPARRASRVDPMEALRTE
jgi:putative ABC transport system permease protein